MASDATHVSVGAEGGGPIIPGPFPSSGTGCPPPPRSWNATSGLLAGCGVHDRIGKPVPSVPFVARISCGFMSTDDLRRPLSSPTLCGWGGPRTPRNREECYLVDPASSHMLVSKIKPCMCKYELIQIVKLRMAH
ncbi:hypothetical protein QJS10_CPA08g00786 [Acorus calamus]|uniref:Uncharacterized protein n=1 Tax=Acorus calamus TaxID=4465 RepID=A0AAV9EBX2_ACOCL|nr:hypothetical protein QJS10_CPA08g00786 [Acorus calamus]